MLRADMRPFPCVLSLVGALTLVSCYSYETPMSYDAPAEGYHRGAENSSSSASRSTPSASRTMRPSAKAPARVAVARVEVSGNRFRLFDGRDYERPEHAAMVNQLPGVAGMVSLNNVSLRSNADSYEILEEEARKLGADLLAVYRFDTTQRSENQATLISVATLGVAPTQEYRVVSNVSLIVRDARTGYVYGVSEAQASRTGLATGWGDQNAMRTATRRTRQEALDKLMRQVPGFWSGVARKLQ